MRICFYNVTASFIPGGLETYCWEVARAMARRGHEVTIVAGDRGGPRHDEVRLVQFPFRIEQSWPDLGTRFRRLMERFSFAYGGGLRHLVEENYDAVVVVKPFDFPVLWQARRRGMKSRTVFRSGGTDFFWFDRHFLGAVDFITPTSRYNAAQLEARYHRPVTVIADGVDPDRFKPVPRPRDLLPLPDDAQLIISVGRLVGWKGLQVVIETLPSLPSHVHYLAIGEGPERDALQQLAERLGVAQRVHFAGRISHELLPQWFALGDVLVQPSIGEEAFGISVVEAMACGLPVLGSDNGGMKETVVPGLNGHLVPARDVPAWRDALARILSDHDGRRAMGAAGRARALEHFTWAANAAALEKLLTGR